MTLEVVYKKASDLIPYVNNSRTHSDEQITQVASSIKEFGFTNPILIDEDGGVIAGHGRLMASKKLGLDEVPTITLAGLTEAQKKAYVIADNQLALNAGWDSEKLSIELDDLKSLNYNIDIIGFNDKEIDKFLNDLSADKDNPYTKKVEPPVYEPTGEKPDIKDLYDDTMTFKLVQEITESKLPQHEKDFLRLASGRHTVLNFELIAEYYCHASPECQKLMEDNALVIIDFDKAIENGYVTLSDKITEQYSKEYPDE